jgi:uncharacterized protein (TIGR03435 family)
MPASARMKRAALIAAFAATAAVLSAQAPADPPRFEVASVRPNTSDGEPSMTVPPRGSVVVTNVPLENLIVNAYGIPPFRVVNAPDWIRRERFDITGKPPDNASPGDTLLMLRALLENRFRLRVHRETRDQPIYALTLAHEQGRPGPELKRASTDCSAGDRTSPPLPASQDSACSTGFFGVGPAGGTIVLTGQPLRRLISALSMAVSRTVVDRTGLEGVFDVRLRWSADVNVGGGPNETPSVFTALQEQLGLKLEPAHGPVDVLVIDGVERPTPD